LRFIVALLVLRLPGAALMSGLFGLPFDPHEPGSAWIVFLIVLAETFRPLLPYWLYRDEPVPAPGVEVPR
jgi:hypothetical protein